MILAFTLKKLRLMQKKNGFLIKKRIFYYIKSYFRISVFMIY